MLSGFQCHNQWRGFTLLEMLVVLVLSSMITGLLMQALNQSFMLQTRFSIEAFQAGQGLMQADWYRHSINGMMPDEIGGKFIFKGEARQMTGLTSAAPLGEQGSLQPLFWKLKFDPVRGATLLEIDGPTSMPILSWAGDSGKFLYLDASGTQHDAWPPALGEHAQLPRAVLLEYGPDTEKKILVAVIKGPDQPGLRLSDVEKL